MRFKLKICGMHCHAWFAKFASLLVATAAGKAEGMEEWHLSYSAGAHVEPATWHSSMAKDSTWPESVRRCMRVRGYSKEIWQWVQSIFFAGSM